jgi:ribonuclease P protein subunit RPR2
LGIPDDILCKSGPLAKEEAIVMRRHPQIGCDIVGHIDFLAPALLLIRHHHERYDGTGYPDKLAGKEIPLFARIFAVVDAYDVEINQQPHGSVHDLEKVLDSLRQGSGTLFDPHVVEQFCAIAPSLRNS